MADIVLTTLNARFIHAAFGLRYLRANLGPLRDRSELVEFDLQQTPVDIVESLLAHQPRIIGLGVYIWNARPSLEIVRILKQLRPDIRLVLGGPEVSHETDSQEIVALADHTIAGEADLAFVHLCQQLLAPSESTESAPLPRVIRAPLPDLTSLRLPYEEFSDADLARRILYVEASRGCPFTCEFCLSSLDEAVRTFPLDSFLAALRRLLDRGARQFKFVDRTFNLNLAVSRAILRFFRDHWRDDLFLHFEMIPDRLPEALREEIAWFPPGALQFEIGIQSFNPDVCARIRRRQDFTRLADNLRFLRERTGVHVHADLIAGLPGESLDSFAHGFDRLLALGPQEIQFGILKRLRGTSLSRHDADWAMRYNPGPPYEILENRHLDFATLQRLRRFSRFWDLIANSGRFRHTVPLIWCGQRSPFHRFLAFSDWLYSQVRQTHSLAPDRIALLLFRWLTLSPGHPLDPDPATVRHALRSDWLALGRRDLPEWLTTEPAPASEPAERQTSPTPSRERLLANRRQRRHSELGSPP